MKNAFVGQRFPMRLNMTKSRCNNNKYNVNAYILLYVFIRRILLKTPPTPLERIFQISITPTQLVKLPAMTTTRLNYGSIAERDPMAIEATNSFS